MNAPEQLMKVDSDFRPLTFVSGRQEISGAVSQWSAAGLTVRYVRGRKMRAKGAIFDEFAAAFQFPSYFGQNWDAFNECISDLDDHLPFGKGYVVVITEPDLVSTEDDSLNQLIQSFCYANEESWSQPVERGAWWDRPAVPFHVVLAGEQKVITTAEKRWTEAGATLLTLEGAPAA